MQEWKPFFLDRSVYYRYNDIYMTELKTAYVRSHYCTYAVSY
jgi:hypothetical protein